MNTFQERMRDKLVRRNYAASTIRTYLRIVQEFGAYTEQPVDYWDRTISGIDPAVAERQTEYANIGTDIRLCYLDLPLLWRNDANPEIIHGNATNRSMAFTRQLVNHIHAAATGTCLAARPHSCVSSTHKGPQESITNILVPTFIRPFAQPEPLRRLFSAHRAPSKAPRQYQITLVAPYSSATPAASSKSHYRKWLGPNMAVLFITIASPSHFRSRLATSQD